VTVHGPDGARLIGRMSLSATNSVVAIGFGEPADKTGFGVATRFAHLRSHVYIETPIRM
jgi:hypothetical protein